MVLALALAVSGVATPPAIEWAAPAECPDAETVGLAIEALSGESEDTPVIDAIATVEAHAGAFRLTLRIAGEGKPSTRVLQDADCDALAEATALMVAMAVNPALDLSQADESLVTRFTEPGGEPSPEPQPIREAETQPEPVAESEPSPDAASPRTPISGALRLSGGVGWGQLPEVSGSVLGAASLLLPRWRAEVEGSYWLQPEREVVPGVGVRFNGWALALRAGPYWAVRALEFPVLAGVEAGQLIGSARGLDDARVARSAWFAVTLRSGLFYVPIRQIALGLFAEGMVAVTRTRFRVGGLDAPAHRPRAVGIRGFAAVEARFP